VTGQPDGSSRQENPNNSIGCTFLARHWQMPTPPRVARRMVPIRMQEEHHAHASPY
jgi:hypothetical protein